MDSFNYNSIRAKQARFRKVFKNPAFRALIYLLMVLLAAGGGLLIWQHSAFAWLCFGFIGPLLMFDYWGRHVILQVPTGKGETLDDLLSSDVLENLPANPTPAQIAEILPKTLSGRFLMNRLGLPPEFFKTLAGQVADTKVVFNNARDVRATTSSERINGGVLAVALVMSTPNYEQTLSQIKLEIQDLYQVVNWFNYLHGMVKDAKKPRHSGGIARDFAFGYTPLLNRFGTNISEQRANVSKTQIYQAAHQEILNQIIQVFSSDGRQNVALIGPYGSGRTTLIYALAEKLMDADSKLPHNLRFRQIFMLDATSLITAAKGPGDLENLVVSIMNEAYAARNVIICLENAHLFFEEGNGSVDISNVLLPILEAGLLRIILTLDQQRYLEISTRNTELANSLNKIMVPPANEEETMMVLKDQVPLMEAKNKVMYMYQSLGEAYRLGERYLHDIENPGKSQTLLESAAHHAENGVVTAASVQRAVEQTEGVKVQVAQDTVEKDKLLNLEDLIHQRMIDQTEAVAAVSDALRRAAAGVRNQNRPIGTFLFLGPTGVGKTELSKAISEVYFNGESNIVRIDLNEFVEAKDVARLIADGADDAMSLTAQVLKQPFAVVLFDEIEKAHPQVLTTLLQVLDEGVLRDAKNREVSFRDTIIVATSNAGADKIREMISAGKSPADAKDELVNHLIQNNEFRPEFLNRFDEICVFKPLSKEDLLQVLDLILQSVNKTLVPQKISVAVDDQAKQLLVERGYDPQMGARPMRRIVQKAVENIVAKAVLEGTATPGSTIQITAEQIEQQLTQN